MIQVQIIHLLFVCEKWGLVLTRPQGMFMCYVLLFNLKILLLFPAIFGQIPEGVCYAVDLVIGIREKGYLHCLASF